MDHHVPTGEAQWGVVFVTLAASWPKFPVFISYTSRTRMDCSRRHMSWVSYAPSMSQSSYSVCSNLHIFYTSLTYNSQKKLAPTAKSCMSTAPLAHLISRYQSG